MYLTSYVREDVVRKKTEKRTDDIIGRVQSFFCCNVRLLVTVLYHLLLTITLDSHLLEISCNRVLGEQVLSRWSHGDGCGSRKPFCSP